MPHVTVGGESTLREAQHTADQIRAALDKKFDITHRTLELECAPLAPTASEIVGA